MTYQVPVLIGGPHHGTAVTRPAGVTAMVIPVVRVRYVTLEEQAMPDSWSYDDHYVLKDYALKAPIDNHRVVLIQMLVWEGCSDEELERLLWEFLIAGLDRVFGGQ